MTKYRIVIRLQTFMQIHIFEDIIGKVELE